MDWTIVVSVLVALLLWPVALMSVGALVFLTVGTVLRARLQGLMESKMAHCKEMFSSFAPATGAAGAAGTTPCPCAPSGGGEGDA